MKFLKSNYDRVLAIVMGIVFLGLGILAVKNSLSLSEEFNRQEVTETADYGFNGEDSAKIASAHLAKEVKWQTPTMPGIPQKPIPLTRSVPIWVNKDNVEIDLLNPASQKIRPPLDNDWAFKHGLNVGRTDLLRLDEDKDGFTTQEEFESGKTDPNDPKSHPDYTNKLSVIEIKEDSYSLQYRTGDNPEGEFGIREEATRYEANPRRVPPKRKSHFLKLDVNFGTHPGHRDRYKITGFEKRTVPGAAGGLPKQAHKLTMADAVTGESFVLEYRDPRTIYTYFAVFRYALPGKEANIGPLKLGDTFELPNDPAITYELIEVKGPLADGAKIRKKSPAGETPKDITIMPGTPPEVSPEVSPEGQKNA
ncbi:MAG: Amuc_1099 family pilus-like system protein [Verrucomicrobiales bacterium]